MLLGFGRCPRRDLGSTEAPTVDPGAHAFFPGLELTPSVQPAEAQVTLQEGFPRGAMELWLRLWSNIPKIAIMSHTKKFASK